MQFLAETSLPGMGDITGAFLDRQRGLLAAGCSFQLLTEPRARASYGGHHPRYRVALYEQRKRQPLAIFDKLRFPINDVAFHPTLPVAALATGSYDGGWTFEGELLLWNWETGQSGSVVESIPEVIRVAFDVEGEKIVALVRPWDEGMVEDLSSEADPFNIFFEIKATFLPALGNGLAGKEKVTEQLSSQTPISGEQVKNDQRFASQDSNFLDTISQHCETGPILSRSPIWDVAWFSNEQIGIVHDNCQLEILNTSGTITQSFSGAGHGCELFGGPEPLIHVSTARDNQNWHTEYASTLYRLKNTTLKKEETFIGSHTFSVSSDGRILARLNKSWAPANEPSFDRLYTDGVWHEVNLGRYDVFNHYVRVNNSPYLFFVQDDDPERDPFDDFNVREKKWLCILKPDGSIRRMWRILRDDGTDASHAMECAYALISNRGSEAMVVAGKHYEPNPSKPFAGFIYRKELNSGKEMWRHKTTASPTVLRYAPELDVILAFFLNGNQMVIDASSGRIIREARFTPGSLPTIVCACDVFEKRIALGTIDGRVAIAPVEEIAT
ncbi:MAG: hypothetical protein AAGA09_03895 [Pseudomonadota bacterium]